MKTGKSSPWNSVTDFFKKQRRLAWETIRIFSGEQKKKLQSFRIRQTKAWLKGVGKVRVVCSEFKKRLQYQKHKRKFIVCSYQERTNRQILRGYAIRFQYEIFHKHIKMNLGFEDVATTHFSSVESHVYLVYCAYILLNSSPPGVPDCAEALSEKQQYIAAVLENKKTASILQKLTQFGGVERYKDELKSVLAEGEFHKPSCSGYGRSSIKIWGIL